MSEVSVMDEEIQGYIDGKRREEEPVEQGLTSNKSGRQSPGEMLHEARLAEGYSIDELNQQTRLPNRTIEALEDDNYGALSQPVFARGYFRKCAKVLGMDEDALMAAYTASGGAPAVSESAPMTSVNIVPPDVTPDKRRGAFGTIFLVLVLLVAGFAVYLFWSGTTQTRNSADNGSTGITLATEFGGAGTQPAAPDEATSLASVISGAGASSPADLSQDNTQVSNQPAGDSAAAAGGQATAANAEATATAGAAGSGGGAPGNSASSAAGATAAGQSAVAAAPASTVLKLSFDERSWISVHDATGSQLLVGIYQSTTRTLDGVPPYKVVIGYAPGVEVEFGGEPVDFQVADNHTARFTVGTGSG